MLTLLESFLSKFHKSYNDIRKKNRLESNKKKFDSPKQQCRALEKFLA